MYCACLRCRGAAGRAAARPAPHHQRIVAEPGRHGARGGASGAARGAAEAREARSSPDTPVAVKPPVSPAVPAASAARSPAARPPVNARQRHHPAPKHRRRRHLPPRRWPSLMPRVSSRAGPPSSRGPPQPPVVDAGGGARAIGARSGTDGGVGHCALAEPQRDPVQRASKRASANHCCPVRTSAPTVVRI